MAHTAAVNKQLLRDLHAAHDTGNAESVSGVISMAQFAYDMHELSAEAYAGIREQASGWGYDLRAP